MKPRRRLALRREALNELSPDQLAAVVAGQATGTICSLLCVKSWHTEEC